MHGGIWVDTLENLLSPDDLDLLAISCRQCRDI